MTTENKDNYKLEESLGHRELILQRRFTHPRDWYLIMVLCRIGEKPAEGPDTREWVTWYFNTDSGGFNEGHYFHPVHEYLGDLKACEKAAYTDFLARCARYCCPERAVFPYKKVT